MNKKVKKHSLVELISETLDDLKAQDIVCLDVCNFTDVTDTMIIASGTSNRQVSSIAENAATILKKAGHDYSSIEGANAGEWVLVDFGDAVLHVMQTQIREFYDLERLWSVPADDVDTQS